MRIQGSICANNKPIMANRALLLCLVMAVVACREETPAVSEPPRAVTQPTAATVSSEETVRTLVSDFGKKLQLVSLLAPPDVLQTSMREHYASFVTATLLQRWIDDPTSAPGRQVSSPWPDRIEIKTLTPDQPHRYVVDGEIVEITSDRIDEHRSPVRLIVEETNGAWRIADFSTPSATEPGADAAVAVIHDYYAAIHQRDYERAYRDWSGEGSASGQSLAQFKSGFADTAAVEIETGTPGRIDPAAGSRYIEIPIEITATTTAGKTQHFRGKYVLRRSVVDGASAEQRQWRIASAEIARREGR